MIRPLEQFSAAIGTRLPERVVRRLRSLRIWTQLVAGTMLSDLFWAWLNARIEPLGLVLLPGARPWIGWTAAAICLPLVVWEMIYDSRNPRPDRSKESLPKDPGYQSMLLFWFGLCALVGVCASIFFALSLSACVAISCILAIPGFFPAIRDRIFDFLFGKRAGPSDFPRAGG